MPVNGKFTVSEFSDMAHMNPNGLKQIIQDFGSIVSLDGRPNVDLIDLACALQDGSRLPDWARPQPTESSNATSNETQPLGSIITLEDMVRAGKYDWFHPDINDQKFKVLSGDFNLQKAELLHFDAELTPTQAIKKVREEGCDLRYLGHLLCYGATYPDDQRKFPIVALGSFWYDMVSSREHAPCLGGTAGRRDLRLESLHSTSFWSRPTRFLVYRK